MLGVFKVAFSDLRDGQFIRPTGDFCSFKDMARSVRHFSPPAALKIVKVDARKHVFQKRSFLKQTRISAVRSNNCIVTHTKGDVREATRAGTYQPHCAN
jgi:hypothetical protein